MLLSAVFLIVLIASCAISSSAYLGVNGNMVWRQSDSIAQILSFSGWKGLSPMDDFLGRPSWYATPVYELIVSAAAGITRISGPQGFLTAAVFTDLACFWLLLFSGYRLAEKISDGSGLWLIFLLSVSPLYLHYYSVPIPDTMALALSVTAVSLLTGECRGILRQSAALLALSVACFIKSPVPFVLMVFFLSRELLLGHLISRRKLLITVSLVALLSALLPEYLRNRFLRSSGAFFAQDPEWYFGTLDDRLSARFWKTMVNRVTKAAPVPGCWRLSGHIIGGSLHLVRSEEETLRVNTIRGGFSLGLAGLRQCLLPARLLLAADQFHILPRHRNLPPRGSAQASAASGEDWEILALCRGAACRHTHHLRELD